MIGLGDIFAHHTFASGHFIQTELGQYFHRGGAVRGELGVGDSQAAELAGTQHFAFVIDEMLPGRPQYQAAFGIGHSAFGHGEIFCH